MEQFPLALNKIHVLMHPELGSIDSFPMQVSGHTILLCRFGDYKFENNVFKCVLRSPHTQHVAELPAEGWKVKYTESLPVTGTKLAV